MKSKAYRASIRNRQSRQASGAAAGNDGTSASTQSWMANSGASTGYYIDTDKTLAQLVTDVDVYTIQMWVKLVSLSSLDWLLSSAVTLYGVQMTLYGSAATTLRHRHGGDVNATGLTVTNWNHVVLRKNGASTEITVNDTKTTAASTENAISAKTLEIFGGGQDGTDGLPARYADGRITDFVVWDRYLTDGEVTTLYNSGATTGNGSVQTADITLQYTFDQPTDGATGTINDISGNDYHGTVRQEATGNDSVLPTLEADVP